ncbi:general substrate transporter [Infundibulicybe gibba]|nr:general substrate transporter [Infundibulicybe gibba]
MSFESKHGCYRNAYLLAGSAAMGSIFYGWDTGLIGGVLALRSFQDYFGLDKRTPSQRANLNGDIVSVLQAGCFFGALSTGYFSAKYGRKWSLLASGVIYILGSIIQAVVGLGTNPEVGLRVLYLGRFVGGVGVGMVSALIPTYVSECSPRAIRGRCTGLIQFSNNLGIMFSFWVNYGASKNIKPGEMQWRIPFIMQLIPGILFVIAMVFQPESPRWLVERGKYEQAAQVLAFVGRTTTDDAEVKMTLEKIQADFAGKREMRLCQQFTHMKQSRSIALRCFIPSLVMFFQQWTGTNAINYFSPQIFAGLGISGTTSDLFATGIYGVIKVISVGTVVAFAVEGIGRKKCLIIGGMGQCVTMLWIGGYTSIHSSGKVVPASYVSIVAVYLYAVFYCVGWGPLPGPKPSPHVGSLHCDWHNWLFAFTIAKITPVMLNTITYGTFLLFGFCCLVMSIWAYACLPETSGYALEDIGQLFERTLSSDRSKMRPVVAFFWGPESAT